jgi:membrane-associated protease RseP (regulator of RpoE activity)
MLNTVGISNATFEKVNLAYQQLKLNKSDEVRIKANGSDYFIDYASLGVQLKAKQAGIVAYYDTPAYRSKITGAITEVDYKDIRFKILNHTDLSAAMGKLKPGDKIILSTTTADYNITLAASPLNQSKAYLGTGIIGATSKLAWLADFIILKNDQATYYHPNAPEELSSLIIFIYNLLYWLIMINGSVMLFNMLPFAIFDGGRFFYLTVLGLTKSRKISDASFRIMNSAIFILLMLMMAVWLFKMF